MKIEDLTVELNQDHVAGVRGAAGDATQFSPFYRLNPNIVEYGYSPEEIKMIHGAPDSSPLLSPMTAGSPAEKHVISIAGAGTLWPAR